MNRMNQQLKKGIIEVIILQLLLKEDMYGYQITKKLKDYPNLSIREGTLYPLLYRLEDAKLVLSKWVNQQNSNKPKKYYEITDQGKQVLDQQKKEWFDFVTEVGIFLKGGR